MKRIFFALVVLLITISAQAQQLPKNVEVSLPSALNKPLLKEREINEFLKDKSWGQNKATRIYWTVYSDREDNVVYSAPNNNSATDKRLSLGQELRIAKIQNGFALVYEDNFNKYPIISEYAKCYGWVPMNKLLLWHTCPTNDYGIYQKALIVANLDELEKAKSTDKVNQNDFLRLYANPEKKDSKSIRTSLDFNFIMKRLDNGMVLLATECNVQKANGRVVKGWVKKNTYVEWNQRTCIEPNWEPQDVERLSTQAAIAKMYDNAELAGLYTSYYYNKPNSSKREYEKYRISPNVVRYPILDYSDSTVYCCNYVGTPNISLNDVMIRKDKAAEMMKMNLEAISNMNIIICIDATTSMENYYPPVYEAIIESMDYIPDGLKLKVGIVLYRDYADGEGVVEYLPLTNPTSPRLREFLKTGGKFGVISAAGDRTLTEAVYKGIETALDSTKMGYKKSHSNFLLVVGDCGNAENDRKCMTQEQLSQKFIDNNVQLLSYQVMFKNESAWMLFNNQMSDLITQTVKTRYDVLNEIQKRLAEKKNIEYKHLSASFIEKKYGYEMENNNKELMNFYLGSHMYGNVGIAMEGSHLKELLVGSVNNFVDYIDYTKRRMEELPYYTDPSNYNTTDGKDRTIAVAEQAFVRSKVSDSTADFLYDTNSIMSFVGYTKKTEAKYGNTELWKPILFISTEELAHLIDKLAPLYNAAKNNDTNNRRPYIEAVKALLRSMLPGITEHEMNKISMQEIMQMVTGLNVRTGMTGGKYTLIDINEERVVSKNEYNSILRNFKTKYEKLQSVTKRGYKYFLISNNQKYYWLPITYLP